MHVFGGLLFRNSCHHENLGLCFRASISDCSVVCSLQARKLQFYIMVARGVLSWSSCCSKLTASKDGTVVLGKIEINPDCSVRRLDLGGPLDGRPVPTGTVVNQQPLEIGKFCLHLVAHSAAAGVRSFLVAYDSQYELEDWFKALHRLINPPPPPVPKKTYVSCYRCTDAPWNC